MKRNYARRRRRQRKMKLRTGGKFNVRHKAVGGRTGMVMSKRTPSSKRAVYRACRPNPPVPNHDL